MPDPLLPRLVKFLFWAGLLLFISALWQRHALPPADLLRHELRIEPDQRPTDKTPFQTTVGGVRYTVKPLYQYQLSGLVVSQHHADSWWDYLHREWNDHLNITDLCVLWGKNAQSQVYQHFKFWSGQFTCNYQTPSQSAYEAFDHSALSNNHLLTNNPELAKRLKAVRVGDQITLRGYLVEYEHQQGNGFKRGTSTVRTDTGNGACETVFIEDFRVLQTGGGIWRALFPIACGMLLLSMLGWFLLPPARLQ